MTETATQIPVSTPIATSTPSVEIVQVVPTEVKTDTGPLHPVEVKTEDPKPAIEVDGSVAKHFAELERRKAAFAVEKKQMLERQKAEEPEFAQFKEWQKAKENAKKNPLEAFKYLGVTEGDLANALLQTPAPEDPVSEVRRQLEEMKAERQAEIDAVASKNKSETDAKNIAAVRSGIVETLKDNAYEYTRSFGEVGTDMVFDVMTEYFVANKQVLPYAKACAEVEKYFEGLAAKAAETEKFKGKIKPPATEKKEASGQKTPIAEQIRNITNKTTADTPPSVKPKDEATLRANAKRVYEERRKQRMDALSAKG